MQKSPALTEYDNLVYKKFEVFNSLFLSLPFSGVSDTGMLLPVLQRKCRIGLQNGQSPVEILDDFFATEPDFDTEESKLRFMFRAVQYIERQVVLFDSAEDAAFTEVGRDGNRLTLEELGHIAERRDDKEALAERLSNFSARIVFTAHPTQFYPYSVLHIMEQLRDYIKSNDINSIYLILEQLGLTSFINPTQPTPLIEAKNIIYFLENVYYDAIAELYSIIKNEIFNGEFDNPSLIKIGFWPGGDRDGNPNVRAETTIDVADELRQTLMKCYYSDLVSLSRRLTFPATNEPLRLLMETIYPLQFDKTKSIAYEEILSPLNKIRNVVISKYNSLFLDEIDNLINKVRIFKTHFAILDVRQDHPVHDRVVEYILQKSKTFTGDFHMLDKQRKIELLLSRDFIAEAEDFADPVMRDTIEMIKSMREIQFKNGEEGCCRYIISNSEDIYSVLHVFSLFRWCGYSDEDLKFDIVPLIETMEGMSNSADFMRELFSIPEYRNHLKRRGDKQTMMLGFSDGTKDGGYLKANWSIFKTKEILTKVCSDHDIKAIFFDGRGGPPARGGGKTHRFYASQSKHIAAHELQLTIQGQTISSKYGTKEHFNRNFEQFITSGVANAVFKRNIDISSHHRKLIEELSEISFDKYTALKQHDCFLPYLENKSTLKYYGNANITSRPVKRGTSEKLRFSDLRAISFVGSWSQLKQNVPGYYGIGTAIKTLVERGQTDEIKELFREVPFFKALILNSMMSLSKSDFRLTSYMRDDEVYGQFWQMLHAEYELSREMTLLISDYEQLMEEEPITRRSIEIRESIVLPLLVLQQYALQKIEQNSEHSATYGKIVRRSLYGNINAARNSA